MIATLQWITLAVCAGLTIARLPSALRRENLSIFFIFALITLAIVLSIEGPYLVVDRALGEVNLANLLLRFAVFGAIFLLGVRITKGFGAGREYRMLTGGPGAAALAFCSLAVIITFLLTDTTGSSVGMKMVTARNPANTALMELYAFAGRLYPAYVSIVLLPTMARAVRSTLPSLVRLGALFLGVGCVAVIFTLTFPWLPPELETTKSVNNYTAILCFVIGLAQIWIAKLMAPQPRRRS